MTPRPSDAATSYELRIGGHLDQRWSTWFDGFTVTHEDDGTTALRGAVRDQSELHGLLAKIRNLGTTLISVTPLGTTTAHPTGAGETNGHPPLDTTDGGCGHE
jgi:hypothetical protein